MKTNSHKHIVLKLFVVSSIVLLFSSQKTVAQEGAYWMGLSFKNPAAIGTPADWLIGNYSFADLEYDEKMSSYSVFADIKLSDKIGTIGVDVNHEKIFNTTTSIYGISYAYTIPMKEFGQLLIGTSLGYRNHLIDLGSYNLDPGITKKKRYEKNLKNALGVFYNSQALDLGLSYNLYSELKNDLVENAAYKFKTANNFVTILAAYRFQVNSKFVVEPHFLVDFYEDRPFEDDAKTDKFLGVLFNYNRFIWAGYTNQNFEDLHSIILGIDIAERFRLAYNFRSTIRQGAYTFNSNEFVLGYRFNHKAE